MLFIAASLLRFDEVGRLLNVPVGAERSISVPIWINYFWPHMHWQLVWGVNKNGGLFSEGQMKFDETFNWFHMEETYQI